MSDVCSRCWWGECDETVRCYDPENCPCPGPHAEPEGVGRDEVAIGPVDLGAPGSGAVY